MLVQVVQHLSHPPMELATWPDESRVSRLVFITHEMPEQQVRALFAALRLARARSWCRVLQPASYPRRLANSLIF